MGDSRESGERDPKAGLPRKESGARYENRGEIARGGMGAILEVLDTELRRRLAMKVAIGTDGEDSARTEALLDRFLEEAQITAQLDHPGVVPVHELGLDEEGKAFFTMKLVKGRNLEAIFELVHEAKEGWTLTRALGVLLRVCEAMAFAHDKRVIHRDLKPANVMVGRYGEVYVMDWGLARVEGKEDRRDLRVVSAAVSLLETDRADARESENDSPLMTMDGAVVGTPFYMPPEQARGDHEALGPRSDVYAVGAMLYHLLTGRMPYLEEGGTPSPHAVLAQVLQGPPRPLAELAPDAPAELVAVCDKAMARDPGLRYADMGVLADDLRAYLEGRVVSAHGGGAVAELRKWIGRNPALAGSLAASVLLAIGGLATVLWIQTSANRELTALNDDLAEETRRAEEASIAAERNAVLALANEREARWHSYAANIGAASAGLDIGAARDAEAKLDACEEELRGWEWRHLRNRADASLSSATASRSFVMAVAYSPTGEYLATAPGAFKDFGGNDREIKIWNAVTLELVHTLEGHTGSVMDLEFSPSGTELVSSSLVGDVKLWDVERGENIPLTWEGGDVETSPSCRVAYHPDGLHLALGWSSGRVVLWSAISMRADFDVRHGSGVRALAVSPNGERMAVGTNNAEVHVWNIADETRVDFVELSDLAPGTGIDFLRGVTDVEFSADGDELLIALASGIVVVLEVSTSNLRLVLDDHERPVSSARYHPNGRWIVTSSFDRTIRFWRVEDGAALETLHGHADKVSRIALSPSGHRIVSGSYDKTVRLWDGQPGTSATVLDGSGRFGDAKHDAVFSAGGEKLAWRPDPVTVRVTDARSGLDLFTLPSSEKPLPRGMAFSPDGSLLYTIPDGGRLQVWDGETGEHVRGVGSPLPPLPPGETAFLGFDRACERFAAWRDDAVRVWSVETGEELHTRPAAWAETVLFAANDRVVYNAPDGSILVWDLATDEIVHELAVTDNEPWMAVDPTGRLLAAATWDVWDHALWIFDLEEGTLVRKLEGHAQPNAIAWMSDGSRVVTGNWDGTVSLWDPVRGEVASLRAHANEAAVLAVSPDGARIATGDDFGRYVIHESTPVADRADLRRLAALDRALESRSTDLVDRLFERTPITSEVVRRLEEHPGLDPAVRATAIRLARNRPWSAGPDTGKELITYVWQEERTPAEIAAGLRTLEVCSELVPGPTVNSVGMKIMLASAQIRMGRPRDALATIDAGKEDLDAVGGATARAMAVQFAPLFQVHAALAYTQLDDLEKARELYESAFDIQVRDPGIREWLGATRGLVAEALERD